MDGPFLDGHASTEMGNRSDANVAKNPPKDIYVYIS
jgi:hypothetical protein